MNVKRMGEAMVKNLASNLDNLTKLVETSDPAALLQDFNQKITQVETLEANFNKDYNSFSFQTGQDIVNNINNGNYESAINQGLGFINVVLDRKEAKKKLEAKKQALYQQRHNQMSKIYWKAVDFNSQAKAKYLQRAAFSTDLAEEKYNMAFVENLDCHSKSMEASFSSAHTRWLANNCALPNKKQVLIMEDPNLAKDAKFLKLAERKYQIYLDSKINDFREPEYPQFRDAAIHFTAKSISIKPTTKKYLSLAKYYEGVSNIYEYSAYLSAEEKNKNSFSKEQKERVAFLRSNLAQQIKNAIYESDEEFVLSFMKSGFDKLFSPDGQDILDFAIKYDRSDLITAIINYRTKKGNFKNQQALLKRVIMLSIANDSHQTLSALLDAGMTLEFRLNKTSPIELIKKVGALRCLTTYLRNIKKYDEVSHFYQGVAIIKKKTQNDQILYGAINPQDEEVITSKYLHLRSPRNGIIIAKNEDGKFGALDLMGNEKLPFIYEYLGDFSNGLYVFRDNQKYGYINQQGDEIIEAKYDFAEDFGKNYGIVGILKKRGYGVTVIDKKGQELSKPDYIRVNHNNPYFIGLIKLSPYNKILESKDFIFPDKEIYHSHDEKNVYTVKKGKKFYIYQQSNLFTIVENVKSKINSIYYKNKEIYTYNPKDYKSVQIRYDLVKFIDANYNCYLINSEGNKLNIDPKKNFSNLSNGLIVFNKNFSQYNVIDSIISRKNKKVDYKNLLKGYPKSYKIVMSDPDDSPLDYNNLDQNSLIKVGIYTDVNRDYNVFWGYVDTNFKWVIPPIYEKATNFNDGLASVYKGQNLIEIIDRKGKTLYSYEWKPSNYNSLNKVFNDGISMLIKKEGYYLDRNLRLHYDQNLKDDVTSFFYNKGLFWMNANWNPKQRWIRVK